MVNTLFYKTDLTDTIINLVSFSIDVGVSLKMSSSLVWRNELLLSGMWITIGL